MNLVKDQSAGGYAVRVECVCPHHLAVQQDKRFPLGKMFTLAEGYADTDGVPFQSYYCNDCVAEARKQPCPSSWLRGESCELGPAVEGAEYP